MLKKENRGPSEREIAKFIKTLKPTKTVKGVKREKRPAELRCEAKRKLIERKAKQVAPRYSLYALRHSWATNALKRGIDPLTVALLMGHKDPSMLARVYQHLSHSPDHMREQARKATSNWQLEKNALPGGSQTGRFSANATFASVDFTNAVVC